MFLKVTIILRRFHFINNLVSTETTQSTNTFSIDDTWSDSNENAQFNQKAF